MNIENVTEAIKFGDGSIELVITDPLTLESTKKRYQAIRGGLSWPSLKAPAYFCLVSQEYVKPPIIEVEHPESGRRILIAEHEDNSLSLNSFFSRLTDLAEKFGCVEFYADLPEDKTSSGYLSDFEEFTRRSNVFVTGAYDANDFYLGISRIKGSILSKSLTIPQDSLAHEQLTEITRDDLENPDRFHAINALRHVIGSYYRCPPIIGHETRAFSMDD